MNDQNDIFLHRKLTKGIGECNLFDIEEALIAGTNPLKQCDDGFTPFEKAARVSDIAALELMLAQGVPIDWQDAEGRCLLHFCAEDGMVETAEFLLKNHANPALQDSNGDTPLHYAARHGEMEVAQLILEETDCTETRNHANKTALGVCRSSNDVYPLLTSFFLRKTINQVVSGARVSMNAGQKPSHSANP